MKKIFYLILLLICIVFTPLFQGCVTLPPHDYSTYLDNMPRSILVFPPRNESIEVNAPYIYLSTVTRPLAERGYYVFPVAVIDQLMKENGVPSPDEMVRVSLKKIKKVINPDAVLYLTIVDWGTKYQILDSVTIVHVRGRLVDTDSGVVLWQGEKSIRRSSSDGQNNIIAMLVAAIINQIISNIVDPTRDVASMANTHMICNHYDGLLLGHRHNQYEEDQRNRKAIQKQPASNTSSK
jgi:hypothetical protein